MGRSPSFGSIRTNSPPFRTRFRSGSACPWLSLARTAHSSAHSTKGTPSPHTLTSRGSDRPEAQGFRICFTPLTGVLFTVPSRYWFTIGRWRYLALGGGPPCFPPDFSCPAVLTIRDHSTHVGLVYGALTRSGRPFQWRSTHHHAPSERVTALSITLVQPSYGSASQLVRRTSLGSSPFARRYLGNLLFSSRYSDVSLPAVPSQLTLGDGPCAHRVAPFGSPGSQAASASPRYFAAWPRPSSAAIAKASTLRPSSGRLATSRFLTLSPDQVSYPQLRHQTGSRQCQDESSTGAYPPDIA